jgi:small conductance mechanosensitive channel
MNLFSTEHIDSLTDKIWGLAVVFVPRLLACLAILFIALFASRRLCRLVSKILSRAPHIDETLKYVLAEFVRYATIILAIVLSLEQLGVKATSLLAIIGAAGLAIGLALQGTLSNIAAGLMLLWLRPFRLGDYIEVNNVPGLAGTIKRIGLFTSELEAFDGLYLFVPNAGLWNVPLRNYTRNTARLISLTVTVPLGVDSNRACRALMDTAGAEETIARDPQPIAFVERVAADAASITYRFWTAPSHIGDLQRRMPILAVAAIQTLSEERAAIQVIRTVPPDADPSRLMRDYGAKSIL